MSPRRSSFTAHAFVAIVATLIVSSWSVSHAQEDEVDYPQMNFDEAAAATVVRVANMTTLVLSVDGEEKSVELLGVRAAPTPELRAAAAEALDRMLAGESVYVVSEVAADEPATDAGTRPAYIYRAPDGLFINLELVRQGYAKTDSLPRFAHLDLFRHYESIARTREKGVWAKRTAPATTEQREVKKDEPRSASDNGDTIVYVTRTGKKYHTKDCEYAQKSGKPVPLREAAKTLGPCSRCKPPVLSEP